MSLDQGHRQLADFADQGLETLGFLHPFSDLLEKILGHINGACLATVPEGDVVGLVQRAAVMAGAGRLAAAFVHLHEAGRQDGAGGNKLLESPVQHPADQCRVAGNTHGWAPRTSSTSTLYRKRPEKPAVRRKKFSPGEADRLNGSSTLDLCCRQGATNFLFLGADIGTVPRDLGSPALSMHAALFRTKTTENLPGNREPSDRLAATDHRKCGRTVES